MAEKDYHKFTTTGQRNVSTEKNYTQIQTMDIGTDLVV